MADPLCYAVGMKNKHFIRSGLIVPTLDPKKLPRERLLHWLATPRIPVLVSQDPMVTMCRAGAALITEGLRYEPRRKTYIFVNNRLEGNALATIDAMLALLAPVGG